MKEARQVSQLRRLFGIIGAMLAGRPVGVIDDTAFQKRLKRIRRGGVRRVSRSEAKLRAKRRAMQKESRRINRKQTSRNWR